MKVLIIRRTKSKNNQRVPGIGGIKDTYVIVMEYFLAVLMGEENGGEKVPPALGGNIAHSLAEVRRVQLFSAAQQEYCHCCKNINTQ